MSTVTKTLRNTLKPGLAGVSMTPEEFDAFEFYDDRFRYELIRGVLVVSRFPRMSERDPNQTLGRLLCNYEEDHPQGSVLNFTISESYIYCGANRRRADRVIWAGLSRLPDPEKDIPTIAVEFVSESKSDWLRDYEEKRLEYLALGILEYWIIDRFARTMTVFRKVTDQVTELVVPADGTYQTPLLPGFELPLAKLFARADRWRKPKKSPRQPETGK